MDTPLTEPPKVFKPVPWRQAFRAQLAAQIAPSLPAPPGVRPEYLARESVAIADAIMAEVGLT